MKIFRQAVCISLFLVTSHGVASPNVGIKATNIMSIESAIRILDDDYQMSHENSKATYIWEYQSRKLKINNTVPQPGTEGVSLSYPPIQMDLVTEICKLKLSTLNGNVVSWSLEGVSCYTTEQKEGVNIFMLKVSPSFTHLYE